MAQRILLDDETFYETNYGSTGIPKDIPIRVRKVFARELGRVWLRTCPGDKPTEVYDDLDFAELMQEIEDEFSVKITLESMKTLDGSFDSVVRYLANSRAASS